MKATSSEADTIRFRRNIGLFERVTCNSRAIQCKHSILQQRLHLWLAAKYRLPKVHTGELHSTHVKPIKTDSEALERGNIENAFPAATHDPFDQFHRKNPAHKPPIQIQSSRLETITARRIDLRRAVSRVIGASYAIHEAQLRQFKQATLFGMRRRAIVRTG